MEGYYGIGEVFVKVADLERASEFYRDLLGFEVVERNNRQLYIYLENGHLVLKEAGKSRTRCRRTDALRLCDKH